MRLRSTPISNKQSTETSDIFARSSIINLTSSNIHNARNGDPHTKVRRSAFDLLIDAAVEISTRTENAQRCAALAQVYIEKGKDLKRIEKETCYGKPNHVHYTIVDKEHTKLSAQIECFMSALSGWCINPVLMYPNQLLPRRKAHSAFCITAFNYIFCREQVKWSFAHFNKLIAEEKADCIFTDEKLVLKPDGGNVREGNSDIYFNKERLRIAMALISKGQSIVRKKYLKGL
ncbi:MAG: hypothetical protein EOM37_03660 [Proteobacteria bacterium]|nr:hypothetical protein [Pseudomonadota bacterium]